MKFFEFLSCRWVPGQLNISELELILATWLDLLSYIANRFSFDGFSHLKFVAVARLNVDPT